MQNNLNKQMDNLFGVDDYSPKFNKPTNVQTTTGFKLDKNKLDQSIQELKDVGIGILRTPVGAFGDIVSGVTAINSFLADNTYSPMAMLIKDKLIEGEKTLGADGIRKWFAETTGLEYKKDNVFQNTGELIGLPAFAIAKPAEFVSDAIKYSKPAFAKFTDDIQKGVKNVANDLEDIFKTATLDKSSDLAFATAKVDNVNVKPVTKIKKEVDANILNNVVAPNAQEAEKFYEIQTKYLADNKIFATKSATVEDPSGMTPVKEILKLKDKIAQVNYKKLSLEQKQELYRLTGGMYRGRDGKLRKRIDTRNATLTNDAINFVKGANLSGDIKVKDLINYQDLFKVHKGDKGFEDIQNVRIEFIERDPTKKYGRTASYNANPADGKGEVIYLTRPTDTVIRGNQEVFFNEAAKIDTFRQSILHELQHAVQLRNGFENGGSVRRFLSDDYFKDVAVNNSKINNSYANYIKDKLKFKTETDSSNNLYFFINGKRMFVGAGYDAKKLEVNFQELFNSIGQKIINREYDEFFKQKKLYLGKDGLKLKSNEQHFMNILEKKGVLTSPHFNNFIQEMIIRQKEVRRLSKIENKAYEDYFKLPGEQESYSIATYDKLPKNVEVYELNPRGSILLDGDPEDIYTKSVIPKVDVTIGDDPKIQQSIGEEFVDRQGNLVTSEHKVLYQTLGKALEKIPKNILSLPSKEELIKKGFDPQTFYHGSPQEKIQTFVPQSRDRNPFKPRVSNKGAPATFFTTSENYAEQFAEQGGKEVFDGIGYSPLPHKTSRIYPVKLKLDNIFDYNNPKHINKLVKKMPQLKTKPKEPVTAGGSFSSLENPTIQNIEIGDPFALQNPNVSNAIKDLGFNGYMTNERANIGERTVGLFYPDKGNVRSIFARFDPEKVESGNVYASIVPPLATAVGLSALEKSKGDT